MLKARALKALRWPLRLTRAGMLAENITRAFWPFWSWGFVIWAVLAFRLMAHLSVELAYVLALIGVAGLAASLYYGLRRFRWPRMEEAADRIDRSLKGRPLTALWDMQAIGAQDGASTAIWRAHVARMAEQASRAETVEPDLKISDRDPYGLRYMAVTALAMALLFGSVTRSSLSEILTPGAGEVVAGGPVFEGWIEPPRYTGLPGIYLNDATGLEALPIPEGSKVTLRLYGDVEDITVSETLSGAPLKGEDQPADLDFTIAQSGELRITGNGTDRVWQVNMIADAPPTIALDGPVERSPNGEMKLGFQASDDYGVVGGTATLRLDFAAVDRRYGLALPPEPRPEIVLDIPLPFSGGTKNFNDILIEDLSQHPWAGLPVELTLNVTDAHEQNANAAPENIILPGRRFFDPLAAAVVEQRRDLLWNRENVTRVAQVLRAVSYLPEDIFDNQKAYLMLRSAIRRLEFRKGDALSDDLRDEVSDMLWKVALMIEDGNLSDAQARLRRAQERLSEAIQNGATDDEIAALTEDLRRAMQEYLEQLAREAEQNPDQTQAQNGEAREITSDQLQQMLDRIQELTKEGRMAEAQQLLDQLRQMMENMQTARRQEGEGQGQGQQSMRDLADTMRQQQDLSDEAFRQMQEDFNGQRQQGQPGQQPSQPGQNGQGNDPQQGNNNPTQRNLAERQDALRNLLERQRGNLPATNSEEGQAAREALRRAEREMGEAGDALRQDDLPQALDRQADALEALREGLENLGQELARNQDGNMGRQGDQAGSPDPDSNRDPLGRQAGTTGRIGSERNLLNGDDPVMRSRELMDEIRRRSGDKSRPKIELDYLERLLDRF
ncbi:MAG: TIGR02302 family protein [Alphaproteobacteria bacterium]|nr:TIGR02302 family protein [Alphaproteobacteria bacterium]